MKERFRRGLAFLLSFAMLLGMSTTAGAESASAGSVSVAPGTYSVPVSNSDPVAAMNTEFGGVVTDTATATVKADGTVSLTLTLQAIKVMTSFDAWIDSFNGYYEGGYEDGKAPTAIDIKSVSGTLTANDGASYPALAEATFTASSLQSSYTLAYHLKSTVMEFDRHPVLTVDWANRKALAGDKTALNAKIEEVSKMDSTAYTAESWNRLAEAANAASALAENADQTAIDNALAAINKAIAALVAATPAPEGAVASITAADGTMTYYTSLFDKAEVSDGEGNVTSPAVPGAVSSLKAGETLTLLKDEEISGVASGKYEAAGTFALDGSAVFNMNGKTVKVTTAAANAYAFRVASGKLTVQGGTLDVSEKGGAWRVNAGAELVLTGAHHASAKYATVDCYGGIKADAGVTLENCGDSNAVWGGGNQFTYMTLDGVTASATGPYPAVSAAGGSAATVVSIKNSVITGEKANAISVNGKSENVTLEGNQETVKSTSNSAINITGNVKVTIGEETAETTGLFAVTVAGSADVTVNGGKYKAVYSAVNAGGTAVLHYPENKVMSDTPNGEGYFTLTSKDDYVPRKRAKIGETYYETLYAALEAVKDGETIQLLEAETLANNVTLGDKETPASCTIDLHGNKLMLYAALTLNQNLTIMDSTETKGELEFQKSITANNTAGLILKNLTISSGISKAVTSKMQSETGLQILDCTINQNGASLINGQRGSFSAPVLIRNCEINGTNGGCLTISRSDKAEAGTVVIENTKVTVAEGTDAAMQLYTDAIVRNCTVSGGNKGISIYSGSLEGNNQITGSECAVFVRQGSAISINGGTYYAGGEYAVKQSRAKIEINGGAFQGTKGAADGLITLPEGKKLTLNSENLWTLADKTGEEPEETAAAEITYEDGTSEKIGDLEHLMFYLKGKCTVKVLKDATIMNAYDIPENVDLTFDLNGKKLTGVYVGQEGEYGEYLFDNVNGTLYLTDSSEDKTGAVVLHTGDINYSSAIVYAVGNTVIVDAGTYITDMVAGILTHNMNVTGGTWSVGVRSCAMAAGGDVSISGGRFSGEAQKILGKSLKTGYRFSEEATDGYYTVEEKENLAAYPVGSVLRDSEGTVLNSDSEVTVDMDGKAWLTVTLDSMDASKVTGVKDPDGTAVEYKTETVEDGTVRLLMPLTAVYGKADENHYSTYVHGMNCMLVTIDGKNYDLTFKWADYEGPIGTSTASDTPVKVNADVAAMGTKMEFNVTGTMYTFENGYTFLKMPIDEMAKQYSSSGGIAFGDIKNFVDEDGHEPAYKLMEKAPADMTEFTKFEAFDYVKNLMVSTTSMQEQATMTIAVKVNAMGFDVDLDGAQVTWDNPNVSLDKLIEDAEKLVSEGGSGYTADSWKALNDALAAAKDVKNSTSASEEETNAAKAALKAAIKGLEEVTDWTALNEAIAKAEALKEADYTEETWAAVKEALVAAKDAVTAGTADQTEADTLAANLNDAVTALAKKDTGDKKAMKPGTYEVSVDLRKAGKTSETSMAAAVMDKKGTLTVAEDGSMKLKLTFPKDAVIAGMSAHATGLDVFEQDGSTKMGAEYTTYETTLYKGISASAPSYTGKALTDATISLSYEAEDGIYKAYVHADRMSSDVALYVDFSGVARVGDGGDEPAKADKTQLGDVIGKAESLKEDDYTADSWKKVQDALAAAKTVNADENATQDEVTAAMNNLTTVMSQLVKKGTDQGGKTDKDYTPGTYNAPITMIVDAMNQSFLIDGHVVIAEDGTASMLINFSRISTDGGKTWVSAYDSGTVYYLAFNGYSKDGTSSNLTTDGAKLTWVDVAGKDKDGNDTTYHCLDKVTFPLPYLTTDSQGIAQYLVSLKFFVPGMSHLEFAEDGFDYLVKMNVDMSEIPVKITVDPGKDNNNNGNGNGNGSGNGGLTIPGATTTTRPRTTGINGANGVKISKTGVNTGDTLNTLPWAAAFGIAALAIVLLALEEKLRRREK